MSDAIAPPILQLDGVSISYRVEGDWLDTVRNVSLRIGHHEKYGLVGESGSGKTTLALGIMRYLPGNGRLTAGRILFNGVDLGSLSAERMRETWGGRIGMVYQNPSTALNPALSVGEQIAEVARVHLNLTRARAWERAEVMLEKVRMPDAASVARRYPHQLSGGMLQRALIAMALTSNPQLLIMDEPTTALDVTTEAVVLDLIKNLAQEYRSAILYITHNLGVVARLCDRVGVMYAGEMMEEGPVAQIFRHPLHPYTRGLLGCIPKVDTDKHRLALQTIPGFIPRPDELPAGCIFSPRCPLVEEACRAARPPLLEVAPGRCSACRRWQQVAALVDETSRGSLVDQPSGNGGALLEANDIVKHFGGGGGPPWWPKLGASAVKAVDGISLSLPRGLTLGLVGESGCGKTTFGRCLVGLVEPSAGEVKLGGEVLAPSVGKRPRSTLKRLQMVFQNPDASLNPRMAVGQIIARPLIRLAGIPKDQVATRVAELLRSVNLPASYASRSPEELSGGEKQRVAIARAFAADPEVVICDEPISALDVSVQGALINLLNDLQRSRGATYLFISHDLAAVRHLSDFIAVVYLGRLWEVGTASEVFSPPYHPYTEALLSAIPIPDPDVRQQRIRLEGSVPSAVSPPPGCRFHTRCPRKIGAVCEEEEPPWRDASSTHRICCHIELDRLSRWQTPVLEIAAGVSYKE